MTKQGTSNPSFYFIAENPKGGRAHPTRCSSMAPQPSLPVNIFLNAIMIKIWAVIIINSTHFKATDCYLAYSLGGEKTNNRGNTSILCHSVPHHTSQRNPFIDKGLQYGEEQKMQEAILYPGRAWSRGWSCDDHTATMYWSHDWSCTDDISDHALFTWLIMHWSCDWSCADHVWCHTLIMCLWRQWT